MKRILVCEDEDVIRDFVVINLKRAGYDVCDVGCGEDALRVFEEEHGNFDIVLLDIMMPGIDGFTVCKKLREKSSTIGIIMLTARTQEMDKVSGLMFGADDYITKPFNPLELVARVKSQLRRYRELNPSKPHERQEVISLKHLEINKVSHQVVCYGESIKLTPIEFDILYLLASNPGRVFGTDEIFERVWHEKFYEANNTVMVHIRRLRGKMKDDTREDKIITTVWGVGYKIEA